MTNVSTHETAKVALTPMTKVFTIGFTKKSARDFFTILSNAGVLRVIDVRLNNVSQLAGFSKRDDLQYFLQAICGIEYSHLSELAPTQMMLDEYNKHGRDWPKYEQQFLSLMIERHVEQQVPRQSLNHACLLCSEDKPFHCHRLLIADCLRSCWGDFDIVHL